MIEWSRSSTIALAHPKCTYCQGLGLIRTQKNKQGRACNCVLRAVFRICYNRFRLCVEKEKHMSQASLDFSPGREKRRYIWARKDEEYSADFFLVSRRTLLESEWRIFRFHYLLGADWKLCCRRLGMERGAFFHAVYRIQQKLGRAFSGMEPYGLYPVDEYFGGAVRRDQAQPPFATTPSAGGPVARGMDGSPLNRVLPIRPPLAARKRREPGSEPQAA